MQQNYKNVNSELIRCKGEGKPVQDDLGESSKLYPQREEHLPRDQHKQAKVDCTNHLPHLQTKNRVDLTTLLEL